MRRKRKGKGGKGKKGKQKQRRRNLHQWASDGIWVFWEHQDFLEHVEASAKVSWSLAGFLLLAVLSNCDSSGPTAGPMTEPTFCSSRKDPHSIRAAGCLAVGVLLFAVCSLLLAARFWWLSLGSIPCTSRPLMCSSLTARKRISGGPELAPKKRCQNGSPSCCLNSWYKSYEDD